MAHHRMIFRSISFLPTLALLPGSAAIGIGVDCPLPNDQRGYQRTTANCDAGAFQTSATAPNSP